MKKMSFSSLPYAPLLLKCFYRGCFATVILLSATTMYAQSNANSKKDVTTKEKNSLSKVIYKGLVIDDEDLPLSGANVTVKGQKGIGVITNANGEFEISLPEGKHILVFSYIGMKEQEIRSIEGRSMTIRMEADSKLLGETVVTGIYTRKAESFTGSASTFKKEDLKSIGNQNILQSLSALDPSFVITDNNLMGSNPNAMMDVSISGKSSITGLSDTYGSNPNAPLFILDGFETTIQRISDLSMDRVESITILKDAASSAIYGSKAANGVVVVETKKPEPGKLRFSYNGNYQVAWADLSDYNLMNSSEKLQFEKLSGYYGALDSSGEIFSDSQRDLYYSRLKNVAGGLDSYWMNEPLRTAFTHDHSINAEGGDSAFRYGLTLRFKNNEGVMKESDRKNIDGTVNLSYRIEKFSFTNQTNIYYTDISNNIMSFQKFAEANPYYSKYDANGDVYKVLESYKELFNTMYVYNPLWDFQQKSFNTSGQLSLNNNFIIEYRPIHKMRIVGKFGFTTERQKAEKFKSPLDSSFTGVEALKRGTYERTDLDQNSYDGSITANYGGVIEKHTYNFVAGAQMTENSNRSALYSARGYITDQFSNPNFSTGYPDGDRPRSSIIKQRSASYYLNANYGYDMRYLIDFNVRSDGSSVFGVNNPFSSTWSLGLAWNVNNEKFFKDSNVVNSLKLRGSIGNPGNQNINAKIANNIYTYYTSYQNMFGLAAVVTKWGNKNLKWQRTLTSDIGIDMELFQSRLRFTFDYKVKDSDPILMEVTQPTSTGASTVPMNIGATKNKSISTSLGYDIIRQKDISWVVNGNLLHTKTTYYKIGDILEKLNVEGRTNQTLLRYYDGASNSAIWTVRSLGIDPMTGNEIFVKKDGSQTFKWDSSDEIVCGDTTPDIEGNFGSILRYKGFSLTLNFRYRWGGQAALETLLKKVENISEASLKYNQDKRALHDRWQKPGDIAKFKRIDDTSVTNMSSRFIADDNTLECKTISLGYQSNTAKWIQTVGLSSFDFKIYMNDVFRISSIKEERGITYPFQRSIAASISLNF